MDDVIERYGTNIKTSIIDDENVMVEVNDCGSPGFHAWIFSHDRKVRIIEPEGEIYRMIRNARQAYINSLIVDMKNKHYRS